MSPRFKELFGYRDDEIPNTAEWWMANIFPEDRDLALDNFAKHLADASHPYDQIVRYRHRDGGTVWVRCRGLAVRNEKGEPIRLLGCHTDVTALKRAEEDLRRQAAELREAKNAAERANRAKSIFLANISPRDPHAPQRRDRNDGAAGRDRPDPGAARPSRRRARIGRGAARHHQRHPRLFEDRGGQAGPRAARVSPPRAAGRAGEVVRAPASRQGRQTVLRGSTATCRTGWSATSACCGRFWPTCSRTR